MLLTYQFWLVETWCAAEPRSRNAPVILFAAALALSTGSGVYPTLSRCRTIFLVPGACRQWLGIISNRWQYHVVNCFVPPNLAGQERVWEEWTCFRAFHTIIPQLMESGRIMMYYRIVFWQKVRPNAKSKAENESWLRMTCVHEPLRQRIPHWLSYARYRWILPLHQKAFWVGGRISKLSNRYPNQIQFADFKKKQCNHPTIPCVPACAKSGTFDKENEQSTWLGQHGSMLTANTSRLDSDGIPERQRGLLTNRIGYTAEQHIQPDSGDCPMKSIIEERWEREYIMFRGVGIGRIVSVSDRRLVMSYGGRLSKDRLLVNLEKSATT